ncbi:LysM peptidoglycan-binding domain-containing protein [Lysinibacillus yapensis]|uniref:LysM peptidoglycan-binding domain-containing protein n=1 Tax=Ureibacillus yapensis TaxID=2304605 RepID=A0A396SB92_9BACL|nr:glycosyl hydrolase family 18 protein [Lysinibacillus yapensis]RHW36743.1 LysM peptidoglycan-binding domain-containing protein [Lysinibacillus yapensis]
MRTKLSILLLFCLVVLAIPFTANAQVIHKVNAGDSLTKISKQYGISIDDIAKLNGLTVNSHLVLGQALLIPTDNYVVQPMDSIWKIARHHAISEETLMNKNNITSSQIIPGQKLVIPRLPKAPLWIGSYLIPKDKEKNNWMLDNYKNTLSGVFVFEYRPDANGNIILVEENEAHLLAWRKQLVPYATLTNITEKGFDPDLTHEILNNASIRKKLISNIYALLDSHDYKGIVVDFESIKNEDRDSLNLFAKELAAKLHPVGMELMMAVPPKEGDRIPDYSAAYDYETLGKYVDRLFLMTYNWHWPGGPSGPIAPINKIRDTLDYAVSVVPRSKLMLGIPQYAYDWTINGEDKDAKSYSIQHAIKLYTKTESEIHFDEKAATPWFRYVDEQGDPHEVWFEDSRSLLAKMRLIHEYELAGMGCWHLGITMPQTEELILAEFNILK